jgi:ubiquinone/menaquinone biosynthesis C-methylase UbiE
MQTKNNLSQINPKMIYFEDFLKRFWFIPCDVLQRGIEANVWDQIVFKRPSLDIGVGDGQIATLIYKNTKQFDVGTDINSVGLAKARKTGKYGKVLKDDAQKMSLNSESFYSVVSNSTFEHIINDLKAVSEVARVLKKGGRFYITVPSNFLPLWIYEYEQKKKPALAKLRLNKINKRLWHLHYRSIDEWEKIFKKNGMKLESYKFYFQKDISIFWYRIEALFTNKIRGKELWSYIGFSKFMKVIPQSVIINLERKLIKNKFEEAFFSKNNEPGGMLFMVAKKI